MKKISIGIIGTNFISDQFCDAASQVESVNIGAVYSRTKEKGADFAARHGIPKLYTNFEEFLTSDIDAVYVASPNCKHCEQTLAAILHGKHVLCEKPIASNLEECEKMFTATEKAGVVLLEAMRPAHDSALEAIKGSLHRLGKIRHAELKFCQYSSRYDKYREGEILQAFRPEFSNASVMDIGVYPIHVALRLFGAPTGDIVSRSVILPNGFEGCGEATLTYGDMLVSVSYSKIYDSVTPSTIVGEDGALIIDKISCPSHVTFKSRKGDLEDVQFEYRSNNMSFEIEEFVRMVNEGEVRSHHSEYSLLEMSVLDTIRRQNGIVFPADEEKRI